MKIEISDIDKSDLVDIIEIARLILSWKLGRDDVLDALDISDEHADNLLNKIENYINKQK